MPESVTDAASDRGLERVNALQPDEFRTVFAQCLDVDRWVEALLAERPFPSQSALLASADAHARVLTDDEVASALARHPRLGERATGNGTEAGWSRGEQSAFNQGAASAQEAFTAAQARYEERFGHIYLVCANGRSSEELLVDLESRMNNDPATETRVVANELREICLLRVGKALDTP
ncbi:2-oxo-4-hydroxy-4-carboxy-5-ureidoimidazoline decarboxylase [Lipingzhangella halophila]|uniref:2-oxo-4-hydroxy-4-carboxy-5-ureidoimidazoline decarboxylase n=1 Tax=Lipingzhangella halophila TaxID=1783352 RepID=A0A7W7W224_9ACTN|nr:2-oxo-4-hydroxy-4-carboxy-5-ureidoimidazoline decarboxylase [Lipingzhangella halophila]MBB4930329.1 2-oxo-4-hydroxy-4-carboxy-5-ureidoimidazoline decarboxylase [Lipingzhangella halophila]